jgi:hypothetical protein
MGYFNNMKITVFLQNTWRALKLEDKVWFKWRPHISIPALWDLTLKPVFWARERVEGQLSIPALWDLTLKHGVHFLTQ